jgi:CheY-like chemotaxis protein
MKSRNLLLIDNEPNNVRILTSNFEEAHYKVDNASSDEEAYKKILHNHYDVILSELFAADIDGYRLLERIQRDPSFSNVPVIFITQKSDVWNRIKSFKLGAKDYIVKPMHVKEILARVNMVLDRLERRNKEEVIANCKFVGRLEDISLPDLIEAFGVERKTGILRLYNINGLSGHIYFENGNVINAFTADLHAEEAVFKMMSWQKGRFLMFFCDVNVADDIGMSNMGLLLQGAKRMEQREELLKELPSLNAVLVTTTNFREILEKKELAPDLQYFVRLFDGERSLGRIVDESSYDEITSLKRILKLYKLGFLHVLRDFDHPGKESDSEDRELEPVTEEMLIEEEKEVEPSEYEEEIDEFFPAISEKDIEDEIYSAASEERIILTEEKAEPEPVLEEKGISEEKPEKVVKPAAEQKSATSSSFGKARGTILVLGSTDWHRKNFVDIFTKGTALETRPTQAGLSDIYWGTADFKGGHLLNFVGLTFDKEFTPLMDYFLQKTLGCLLILDASFTDFAYYTYLLSVLRSKLNVPILIVVVTGNGKAHVDRKSVFEKNLLIKERESLFIFNEIDTSNSHKVLLSLFDSYRARMKNSENMLSHA